MRFRRGTVLGEDLRSARYHYPNTHAQYELMLHYHSKCVEDKGRMGTMTNLLRQARIAGATLAIAGLVTGVGALMRFVPIDHGLAPLARLLDSFAPWALVLGLLLSLLAWGVGGRASAVVLGLLAFGSILQLWVEHRQLSLPLLPTAQADLRLLFFNVQADNSQPGAEIIEAALVHQPDVMVFAEAAPIWAIQAQTPGYTALPCPPAGAADPEAPCELWIATQAPPLRHWQMQLNPIWTERYAVLELAAPQTQSQPAFVAVAHLAKPWLSGVAEAELARVIAQLSWFPANQPVIVLGDFNAAPWSGPMRQLLRESRFRGLRQPPGTWPSGLGGLGLPIDQVLVRGGARVVQIRPFGAELGSNHRGLIVDIALP